MSSAFTGNCLHSADLKSTRFDPSSLLNSFAANLQIEARGIRAQTEAMKDRLPFMKTITRNRWSQPEAPRTVQSTEVLDWIVLSAETKAVLSDYRDKMSLSHKKLETRTEIYIPAAFRRIW